MRKKLFTFLLALTASVGMSWADTYVTITQNDFPESGNSFTKDGVTVSVGSIDRWEGKLLGGGSFSTTLGNFTHIEVMAGDVWPLGEGWSGDDESQIWSGNASSVSFSGDIRSMGQGITLLFTIGDPLPTYTVALKAGTVNANKVTLSATSAVEGATVTVTPDEEYEITAFSAKYNTTEEAPSTLDPATGAYSFTMPAFAVTIEATIALKPVPEGDIYAGFTATAGSAGFTNEGSANLVDNKFTSGNEGVNWTKWCANDGHKSVPTGESESCWWIDFEASEALNPTGYILTTGNDTGSEHGRNPKNWVLKAKLNAGDAWTTIATVTNDVTMKNKSFKDYKFFVDQSGTYQYFRFEVFANQGADVMQLCELRLIGAEPVVLADCGLGWLNVPEGGVVGTIGHEDEIVLPQVNASLDFILAFQAHTATLRLGSTDESVLAVYGFNNFAVNGVGECDVYVVHDEDAVFAYDSAAFHVTVNPEPAPQPAVEIGDLNNAEDVTAFLNTYDGQNVPDLTINRPVLNNMYNTLCLPFNMDADQIAASSLNGVEIYEFVDADVTNDELYLYTSEQKHEIVAGRPYLVKFSAASQLDNLDFVNVTINNADLDDQAVTIKGVTFKGTFQPIVLGAQTELNFNGGHLFLMANNTLMWPNTDNPLKPFRAYFTVNVDAGQSAGMPVRRGMPAHIGGPAQIPTGVDQITNDQSPITNKVMINGALYIIRGDKMYDAQGQVVK